MFKWWKSWTVWGGSMTVLGATFSDPDFSPANPLMWFRTVSAIVGIIGARKAIAKITPGGTP